MQPKRGDGELLAVIIVMLFVIVPLVAVCFGYFQTDETKQIPPYPWETAATHDRR